MHRLNSLPLAILFALSAATAAVGQEVELLDFTADSCPACRQMEPVLQAMVASGAPIRRVDVNRERELAARFRIEYLPTFVVVTNGQEVERQVGSTSADRLREMIRRARAAAPTHQTFANGRSQLQPPARQIASPAGQLPTANSQQPAASSPALGSGLLALDSQLLASTVRLRVEDPQGVSYGTGTIIFAQHGQAIVLTCGHIFRESHGRAPVQVELFEPAESPRVQDTVQGEVLGYDLTRDLGLVRIRSARPVHMSPIAPRDAVLQPGDKAASVGCDHGDEPTVWHTRLTAINRYVGPANVEAARTPVQGRSGGGLFNGSGQLIGVCFAADDQGNEGLYVGLPAIYDELDRLELTSVVATPVPGAVATTQPAQTAGAAGWEYRPEAAGVAASQGLVPVASDDAQPAPAQSASLTSGERATLEEIGARSRGGEVIVIIRPQSPGDRCEILSLENPSQEFLRQVSALGNKAAIPRFTSQRQERQPIRSDPSGNLRYSPGALSPASTCDRPGTTEWTAVPPDQR